MKIFWYLLFCGKFIGISFFVEIGRKLDEFENNVEI